MITWKSIVGSILAFFAYAIVVGSTLEQSTEQPPSAEQIEFAVVTFLSVFLLQWLLWQFIIPSRSTAPAEVTSLFPPRSQRSFFSGTIAFGYVQVAIYCLELAGYPQRSDPTGRIGFLVMGLTLIGVGTAERLRVAFSELSTLHERPSPDA